MAGSEGDDWDGLRSCGFQADGGTEILFPATNIRIKSGNRVIKRPRPGRKGTKLDSTGEAEDEIVLEAIFNNDIEQDLEGVQMWPDRLELLSEALKVQTTGTLNLPWKRGIRVRPPVWERSAMADDNRGGEKLSITFWTDNEDNVDRAAIANVSVKASLRKAVEQAVFDAEAMGDWDFSLADLQELASTLAALISLPSEFYNEIAQAATAVRRSVKTVLDAVDEQAKDGNSLAGSLRGSLLNISDLAAAALGEAQEHFPKTKRVTFNVERDLASIATEYGQSFRDLLSVNKDLENPSSIEPGTSVVVFD